MNEADGISDVGQFVCEIGTTSQTLVSTSMIPLSLLTVFGGARIEDNEPTLRLTPTASSSPASGGKGYI